MRKAFSTFINDPLAFFVHQSVPSTKNKCLQKIISPHKSHYFRTTMHSANASTVSNNELYFNASCHFRNRRWHLFLKWQTSPLTMELCERAAGGRLVSCDYCALSNSAVFEFLCSSETVSFQTAGCISKLSLKQVNGEGKRGSNHMGLPSLFCLQCYRNIKFNLKGS